MAQRRYRYGREKSAAINAALAANPSGHILITGGTYRIDSPLLLTRTEQRVTVDASAVLQVPTSYTGTVFRIGSTIQVRGVQVGGAGVITQEGKSGGASTPPGDWTAFHIIGESNRSYSHVVSGLTVSWCGTFARMETTGATGWVNGNIFRDCRVLYPKTMLHIVNGASGVGFAGNQFTNVMVQAGDFTEYGLRSLTGRGWAFNDVNLWDLNKNPAGVSSEITAGAEDVRIIGGLLTVQNVINNAAAGQVTVIDRTSVKPWHGTVMLGADGLAQDTEIAGTPVRTVKAKMPVWTLPDASLPGVIGSYVVPAGVTRLRVRARVMNMSAASGAARLTLSTIRTALGDAVGGAAKLSAVSWTATAENVLADAVDMTLVTVVPGETLSLRLLRSANHGDDTLAGDVGVVGLLVTPTV